MPKIIIDYKNKGFLSKSAIIELDEVVLGTIEPGKVEYFTIFSGKHDIIARIGSLKSNIIILKLEERDKAILECGYDGLLKPNVYLKIISQQSQSDRFNTRSARQYNNSYNNGLGNDAKDSWWYILGVKENASPKEIRSAYISLMKDNHPDKILSYDKERQKEARDISINASLAYKYAKQIKRF